LPEHSADLVLAAPHGISGHLIGDMMRLTEEIAESPVDRLALRIPLNLTT
jgi:hypothetical protein